ncbi:hypothetical protein AAG570_010907 [Ranatra chinensis]|uniref:Uncharacterized protein n=1 Tax=Ranatra chinensis TaxID=642074 RepID=A0ABD0YJD6_9HEMI
MSVGLRDIQSQKLYCDYPQSLKLKKASKRRNMFDEKKKQETTEIGRAKALNRGWTQGDAVVGGGCGAPLADASGNWAVDTGNLSLWRYLLPVPEDRETSRVLQTFAHFRLGRVPQPHRGVTPGFPLPSLQDIQSQKGDEFHVLIFVVSFFLDAIFSLERLQEITVQLSQSQTLQLISSTVITRNRSRLKMAS